MEYKLSHLFDYFDSKQKRYCNNLAQACDIMSISKFKESRDECHKMIAWYGFRLQQLNVEVQLRKVGMERRIDNEYIPLPRVIIGRLGCDLTKRTILVYGHLDVDPASEADGWQTDPFDLTEIEGNLIGRGSSDDKGPCMAWIAVIEAFQKLQIPFPVNLKFLFEAHQESGSEGFRAILIEEKHKFLKDVDFIVVCDNYWLGDDTPCVTYGLRGLCYYFIEIECSHYDLHSGVFGGSVAEAMSDLIFILNSLRDYKGRIHIPHFYDDVDPVTKEEIQRYYSTVDFNMDKHCFRVGLPNFLFKTKEENLLHRWRYPWITVHGIEGSWDKPGGKCNIPHKVIGKVSVRTVSYQNPDKVSRLFVDFVEKIFQERGSPNALRITPFQDGHPFLGNPEDDNFIAARRAVERVWKKKPDLTREGASIPVVPMLARTLQKPLVMIPIGQGSDKVHHLDEKLKRHNYIQGMKVLASYLFEVADIIMPERTGFSVATPKPSPARRFFESKLSHYNS